MKIVDIRCPECSKQIYKLFVQKDESLWIEKNTYERMKRIANDIHSIVCPHCHLEYEAEFYNNEAGVTNLKFNPC